MAQEPFEYEIDGGVVVWDLRRMARADPGDVQSFLETAVELARRPATEASVIRLPDEGTIGGEVLNMVEQYNEFFEGEGIERLALVSADVKNLAVKSRLDVPGMTVNTLDDQAAAVEWAREVE
jgi:hypothetical protein